MDAQPFPIAFFQNKFVKIEDAKLPLMTNALQYGTGFFGGIRGYYSEEQKCIFVFRIDDHYKRFLQSARIFGCPLDYDATQLKKIALDLIKKNAPQTGIYLRSFAYVGNTRLIPDLANTSLDFALCMIPLGEYLSPYNGLKMLVSTWERISDNVIPSRAKISGGYVNSALARKEATDNGFDEAIMLNKDGLVAEGSAENMFVVRDGVLLTPGVSQGILEGITRRSIIKIAKDLGIPIEIRPIERTELYIADEIFLTGTACEVAWVSNIDHRIISEKRGPITKQIQEKFFAIVRGNDPQYKEWLTKVDVK